jgi:hypothetical protein
LPIVEVFGHYASTRHRFIACRMASKSRGGLPAQETDPLQSANRQAARDDAQNSNNH